MPTGPGGLDANGVWQYGEDDTEALASDLLNLGMASVSTEVGLLDAAVAAIVTGQILQVVSTTKTDTFTMTSSTFADITGFSASITPSATSSKIFVMYSFDSWASELSNQFMTQLLRDSTPVGIGAEAGIRPRTTTGMRGTGTNDTVQSNAAQFLDSPATISAITYKVQGRCTVNGQTAHVGRSGTDNNTANYSRSIATITLMEVAG